MCCNFKYIENNLVEFSVIIDSKKNYNSRPLMYNLKSAKGTNVTDSQHHYNIGPKKLLQQIGDLIIA